MKFLIDTNIVIALEPSFTSDFEINTDQSLKFYMLAQKLGENIYINPEIIYDLQRDKNKERLALRKKLINKYLRIKAPPSLSNLDKSLVGNPLKGSNDYVDNCLLASVMGNAVDFLVTEDKKLHRKAHRIGLDSRVFYLQDAITLLLDLFDEPPPPPPSAKIVLSHELNENDPIFNSLRHDYPGFDKWLNGCKKKQREAYVIPKNGTDELSGICIIKKEDGLPTGAKGRTLKLCTLKVRELEFGKRLGELLLKAVFDYADKNKYDYIYFTAFPKQDKLIRNVNLKMTPNDNANLTHP